MDTKPPCPSKTPRVYSNSCLLSWWCHPTISFSVVPFSCLQSFPASGLFPMSQLLASGGQSVRASASVQFSSVVSNSLWPHGLQHSRPPCPSPIPGACSNSCPSCWGCHATISSSVVIFYCSLFVPRDKRWGFRGQELGLPPGITRSSTVFPTLTHTIKAIMNKI